MGGGTELVAAEAATASALGAIATVGGNGSKNAVVAVEQRREESQDASEELSRGLAVWRDLGGSMRQLPHKSTASAAVSDQEREGGTCDLERKGGHVE